MKRTVLLLFVSACLVWAALGCGGAGRTYVPDVTGGVGFTLAGGGTSTVAPGASATYTFTVALASSGGRTADSVAMAIAGLPAGATASFNPNPVPLRSSGHDTLLTVVTSAATPAGTYPLTVSATGGNVTRTRPATLVVSAVAPGFNLRGGGQAAVAPGGTAVFDIGVSRSNPQDVRSGDQVSLRVLSGAHPSMTTSFDTNPVTLGATEFVSHLTVVTGSTTPPGAYTLVIEGTNGTETKTTSVSLTVADPGAFELIVTPVDPFVADEDGVPFGADKEASYTVTMKTPTAFVGTVDLSWTLEAGKAPSGNGGVLFGVFQRGAETAVNPLTLTFPGGAPSQTVTLFVRRAGSLNFTGVRTFRVVATPSAGSAPLSTTDTVTIRDNTPGGG
ncbi:MAG: hypothetical protein KIS66_11555 [Fimbriimonadaceae bacterium]|nr:hypothetical protein [Fimbriimonadaceae bacterium]